mmetsp:Transcript_72809/g.183471  ORF Transcript_72809/g.183471 Transcript_72809/m.183471 type:complete len:345 (+) Transcript_72809:549-1583(+)
MEHINFIDLWEERLGKICGQGGRDTFSSLPLDCCFCRGRRRLICISHKVIAISNKLLPDRLTPGHVVPPQVIVGHDSHSHELQTLRYCLAHPVSSVHLAVREIQQLLELGLDRRVLDVVLREHLVALPVQYHLADVPAGRQLLDLVVLLHGLPELGQRRGVQALRRHEGALQAPRLARGDGLLQLPASHLVSGLTDRGRHVLAVHDLGGQSAIQQRVDLGIVHVGQGCVHLLSDLLPQVHGGAEHLVLGLGCLGHCAVHPILWAFACTRCHCIRSLGQGGREAGLRGIRGAAQGLVHKAEAHAPAATAALAGASGGDSRAGRRRLRCCGARRGACLPDVLGVQA